MNNLYLHIIKPLADKLIALLLIIALLPVLIGVAVILYIFNDGKVFFIQTRIGYKEKTFRLIKFYSLKDIKGSNGRSLPDMQRQFRLGNFLRHFHLDELPQFVNVLKGELSLIGPRPLLPEYLDHYSNWQRLRHNQKPGLSGLAQVKGGNALSWRDRLRYDVFYIKKAGLRMDLAILMLSVRYFIKKGERQGHVLFSESFIDYQSRINRQAA